MPLRLAVLVVAIGLALLSAPASARPYDDVVADGTLRVAVYDDNAPFSSLANGKPIGIDVDLAEAIAAELKLKLDLRLVEAGENVDGDMRLTLSRGDLAGTPLADLMLHVPNDKLLALRNEQVFLTRPYFDQRIAFAWHRGDTMKRFDSLEELEDHQVAVEGTSAADLLLMMAENGRYRKNLKHYPNFAEAAKAYLSGEAVVLGGTRAAVESVCHGAQIAANDCAIAELVLGGMVKSRWELAGAVRSDSRDLGYAIGEAINTLAEKGALNKMFAKYGVTFAAPKGY